MPMKDGHRYQVRGCSIDGTVYWTRFGWMTGAEPNERLWMRADRACAVMDAQRERNQTQPLDNQIGRLCLV